MADFGIEPLDAAAERDYLWEKCLVLYKVVSHNGQLSSEVFRSSTQMAGGILNSKVNMNPIIPWFTALSDFLEWMEKAIKQKGITL